MSWPLLLQVEEKDPVVLTGPSLLGRDPKADVLIADQYASSRHAVIWPSGRQWLIRDLGTVNGTRVNEEPVYESLALSRGDLVRIGRTRITVVPMAPEGA